MSREFAKAFEDPPTAPGEYRERAAASANGTQTLLPLSSWVHANKTWVDKEGRAFCVLSDKEHPNVSRMTKERGIVGDLCKDELIVMQALPNVVWVPGKGFDPGYWKNAEVDLAPEICIGRTKYTVIQTYTLRGSNVAAYRVRK